MTLLSLPTRSRSAQAAAPARTPAAQVLSGLAPQVDHLAELRALIRRAQAAERQRPSASARSRGESSPRTPFGIASRRASARAAPIWP
jgi:hypothetical protein